MREDIKLTDFPFLNVYRVVDPDKHIKNYTYSERKGKDSIAFICYDPKRDQYLLNDEFKPPVDRFVLGAFGGSIDKNKSHKAITIEELKEEAGYDVEGVDVHSLGKVLVSTQMNQYCYLFIAIVDESEFTGREPENAVEAMAKTQWVESKTLAMLNDWKAITIYCKAVALGIVPATKYEFIPYTRINY